MIKKKTNIDLRAKNITFEIKNESFKAIRFYHAKMTIDVISLDNEKEGIKNIPFAHIPKEIKKIIKPQ